MSKLPTVTIIVPFYNQEHVVTRSVDNLLAQDYPAEKLSFVFINDGSTDATGKILAAKESIPRVAVINFTENQGRAKARNAGIRVAQSELVGFLDGDMTVAKDWLRCLTSIVDEQVVGAMGDSRLPPQEKANRLDRYFYSFYRGARQSGESQPLHFRWFLFNNALVRFSALERIGFFNESFTTYGGEDTDLAIRLWEAYPQGLRFSSRAVSYHHHRRTVAEFCRSMESYGRENLPRLLAIYPQHRQELAGEWVHSLKGRLVFNLLMLALVRLVYSIYAFPWLVRYLVVAAVIRGARQA